MKKPDLLILIAVWQFITATVALLFIGGIVAIGFAGMMNNWGNNVHLGWNYGDMPMWAGIIGLSIVLLIMLLYAALAISGGVGLLMRKGYEWARIVSIIHNSISLIAVPAGTIIGALVIIYMTRQDVRQYFNPPAEPKPPVKAA
ncbi:MAG TPA: hypothetical protein VEI27_02640 [Dehalococcoidales bacterium]|nr:hypothetical protein [Dehalococcoidales bacterium]